MASPFRPIALIWSTDADQLRRNYCRLFVEIKTGETLMAHMEDDRLILEKPAHILQRAKGRFAALAGLPSLADELIAERHREAIQENAP